MSDTLGSKSDSHASPSAQTPDLPSPSSSGNPPTMEVNHRLSCSVCKKRFSDPRVLPCLHTLCLPCLKALTTDSINGDGLGSSGASVSSHGSNRSIHKSVTIKCPTCNHEVVLPYKDPELLPVDFTTQKQLALESMNSDCGDTVCDLCTDNAKAISRCMECMVNVCGFCAQAHKRQRKTASHSVVSMHEARRQGTAFLSCPVMCPRHAQEELKMYCETCDQSVCRDCCLVEHREHLVEYSDDVVQHHKRVLSSLVARLQPHIQAVSGGIGAINQTEIAVSDKSTDLHHDINSYFDSYIQALQLHRRSLITHVTKICDGRVKLLQNHRVQLQQLLRDMQHSSSFTLHALSENNSQEFLALKPTISQRLSKLNRVSYQCTPRVDNLLRFKSRAKAEKVNGHEVLGVLETKQLDPLKCYLEGDGIHEARQDMISECILFTQDVDGQPYHKGGEDVRATLSVENVKNRVTSCQVFDEDDGSYRIEYIPQVHATHTLSVFLDGQHIKGSPFRVTVHEGWSEHHGIWHCCTFCSSEGSRQATCACGGSMPGGFKGCGHGHPGHPGKWHWSCCGLITQDSECPAQLPQSGTPTQRDVHQGSQTSPVSGIHHAHQQSPAVSLGAQARGDGGAVVLPNAPMGYHMQPGSPDSGAESLGRRGRDKQVHTVSL